MSHHRSNPPPSSFYPDCANPLCCDVNLSTSDEQTRSSTNEFEMFRSSMRALTKAIYAADAHAVWVTVADENLRTAQKHLHRIREVALLLRNPRVTETQRDFLAHEMTSLRAEVRRIIGHTPRVRLVEPQPDADGPPGAERHADSPVPDPVALATAALASSSTDEDGLTQVDRALASIDDRRAELGVMQARLHASISALDNQVHNLNAATSTLADVDNAETRCRAPHTNH